VGVAGSCCSCWFSISMGITVGTTALVARFTGAEEPMTGVPGDRRNPWRSAWSYGELFSLIGLLGIDPYLRLMGLSPSASAQCRAFVRYSLLGMIPMFLVGVVERLFGAWEIRGPR